MSKVRADQLLVQRGLADSRERARRLIMAGQARVGTNTLVKPATMLDEAAAVVIVEPEPFVSRGGRKLSAGLDEFCIDPRGLRCVDLGASTGGFTDCLLQRGAASVLAVDVGRAQLHQKLREDPRVTLLEGVNARDLPELPAVDFFVADLSFISLRKVLPSVAKRVRAGTPGIVLFKPQFEAGPAAVPRGGVIRNAEVREQALRDFLAWACAGCWGAPAWIECPVHGGDGNVEYLVRLDAPGKDTRADRSASC